jgi:hypothetical protein
MKIWIRKFYRWWYFWQYGVCSDHLRLCERGGGYEPRWICRKCDEENRMKHELRDTHYERTRQMALEKMARLERRA